MKYHSGPIIELSNGSKYRVPWEQCCAGLSILQTYPNYIAAIKKSFPDFIIFSNENIIDIGAHIGTFSIELFLNNPSTTCYCYEPDERNYRLLSENMKLNRIPYENFILRNKAVYSHNGQVSFAKGMSSTTGSIQELGVYKIKSEKRRYFSRNEVVNDECGLKEAVTINEVFSHNDINYCKLLKVDCEGSEYALFSTFEEHLLSRVAFMVIEAHPTNSHNPAELKEFLCERGFEVFDHPFSNGCTMFYCKQKKR
jgi:FkbM family methyltransferase